MTRHNGTCGGRFNFFHFPAFPFLVPYLYTNFPAVGISCFIHGESRRTGVGLKRYSCNDSRLSVACPSCCCCPGFKISNSLFPISILSFYPTSTSHKTSRQAPPSRDAGSCFSLFLGMFGVCGVRSKFVLLPALEIRPGTRPAFQESRRDWI